MGSLEEEKLFQMVHDFIESDISPPPIYSTSSLMNPGLNDHQSKHVILQEVLRSGSGVESEVVEKVLKLMRNKMDAKKGTSLKEWLVMRLNMDGYDASLCQTSWLTTIDCPAGDYEYIEIVKKGVDSSRLIVDIDFKSQFELARPTTAYKKLSETLPSVFVGDEHKLNKVISLLCSAAKRSFRDRGIHMPPWRTITYMQSKWFSHKVNPRTTNREVVNSPKTSKWEPPMVKPKIRRNNNNTGGGGGGGGGGNGSSGLSSQFSSNISTTCF